MQLTAVNEFDLVNAMKKAGAEAQNASKPVAVEVGNVLSVSPIKIKVSENLILSEMQLIIPKSLTRYSIPMTYNLNCSEEVEHEHKINGTTTVTFDNSLKVGDKVILVRQNGGQKYVVLDKAV